MIIIEPYVPCVSNTSSSVNPEQAKQRAKFVTQSLQLILRVITNDEMTLSVLFDVWAYRRYVIALFSSRPYDAQTRNVNVLYIYPFIGQEGKTDLVMRFQFDFAFDRRQTRFRYRRTILRAKTYRFILVILLLWSIL